MQLFVFQYNTINEFCTIIAQKHQTNLISEKYDNLLWNDPCNKNKIEFTKKKTTPKKITTHRNLYRNSIFLDADIGLKENLFFFLQPSALIKVHSQTLY